MLGWAHIKVGDQAAAVPSLDRADALNPSKARIRQQLGACKRTVGDPAGAICIADLDAAIMIVLASDNACTRSYRGLAYMQLTQFNAALSDLDQANAKHPSPLGHHNEVLLLTWPQLRTSNRCRTRLSSAISVMLSSLQKILHSASKGRMHPKASAVQMLGIGIRKLWLILIMHLQRTHTMSMFCTTGLLKSSMLAILRVHWRTQLQHHILSTVCSDPDRLG